MTKVKTVLIGLGHLGKWHGQKAMGLSSCDLVGIVDPDPKVTKVASELFPEVPIYKKVEECLDLFDAALVVAPTSYHFQICKDLINSRKHVFCEKPVTHTAVEAMELKELLGTNPDLVFQVGHSERCQEIWNNNEVLTQFTKNKNTVVTIKRVAPFKGRATDVDVVSDLMIHDIDLLLHLFDETPNELSARGTKILTEHWDYVQAIFDFPSGRRATVESGRCQAFEERSVTFTNETGALFVDLMNFRYHVTGKEGWVSSFEYEKRDHLLMEQEMFYNSILNETPIFVTLNDGLNAVALIDQVLSTLERSSKVEIGQ